LCFPDDERKEILAPASLKLIDERHEMTMPRRPCARDVASLDALRDAVINSMPDGIG
jgi:hypothetical protein